MIKAINKPTIGVENFPNHLVTNDGRVFVKSYVDRNGRTRKAKELKQRLSTDGYPTVKLTHSGKDKHMYVHRIVAEAFIPNEKNKETVNHKDGVKTNNHADNLEWSDRSEQMIHAYDLGLKRSTPVTRSLTRLENSKPVKCYVKETGETKYFLSARECSKEMGFSERWCDKMITEMKGDTKRFGIEYTSLEEVKSNTDKVSFNTLVSLVEYWSIDKELHEVESSKQALKTFEEVGEVAAALARNNTDELRDGIGDVVVTLIILAQQNGMTLEECLTQAYSEIADRKGKTINGTFIKQSDL